MSRLLNIFLMSGALCVGSCTSQNQESLIPGFYSSRDSDGERWKALERTVYAADYVCSYTRNNELLVVSPLHNGPEQAQNDIIPLEKINDYFSNPKKRSLIVVIFENNACATTFQLKLAELIQLFIDLKFQRVIMLGYGSSGMYVYADENMNPRANQ